MVPKIKTLNIFSDSGSETEPGEPTLTNNKNFLSRISDISSLSKNKVTLIEDL